MGSNSHVACGWEAAGSWSEGAITDEPYERIVHVRVRGGRRGKLRPLPGSRRRASPRWAASAAAMNWAECSTTIIGKPRELPFSRSAEFLGTGLDSPELHRFRNKGILGNWLHLFPVLSRRLAYQSFENYTHVFGMFKTRKLGNSFQSKVCLGE